MIINNILSASLVNCASLNIIYKLHCIRNFSSFFHSPQNSLGFLIFSVFIITTSVCTGGRGATYDLLGGGTSSESKLSSAGPGFPLAFTIASPFLCVSSASCCGVFATTAGICNPSGTGFEPLTTGAFPLSAILKHTVLTSLQCSAIPQS